MEHAACDTMQTFDARKRERCYGGATATSTFKLGEVGGCPVCAHPMCASEVSSPKPDVEAGGAQASTRKAPGRQRCRLYVAVQWRVAPCRLWLAWEYGLPEIDP
eukprot:1783453-Prymnesium_polylepis.1